MNIKIESPNIPKSVTFRDIDYGTLFYYENKVYLKLAVPSDSYINIISLNSGEGYHINAGTKVILPTYHCDLHMN